MTDGYSFETHIHLEAQLHELERHNAKLLVQLAEQDKALESALASLVAAGQAIEELQAAMRQIMLGGQP